MPLVTKEKIKKARRNLKPYIRAAHLQNIQRNIWIEEDPYQSFDPKMILVGKLIAVVALRKEDEQNEALGELGLSFEEALHELSLCGINESIQEAIRELPYDIEEENIWIPTDRMYENKKDKILSLKNAVAHATEEAARLYHERELASINIRDDVAEQMEQYETDIRNLITRIYDFDYQSSKMIMSNLAQEALSYLSNQLFAQRKRELLVDLAEALNKQHIITEVRARKKQSDLISIPKFLTRTGLAKIGQNTIIHAVTDDVCHMLKTGHIPVIIAKRNENDTTECYFFPSVFYDEVRSYFSSNPEDRTVDIT